MEQSNKEYFDITKKVQTAKEAFAYNCRIDPKKAAELIEENILSKTREDFVTTKEQGDALEEVVHYLLDNSSVFEDVERNSRNLLHDLDHLADFSFHLTNHMPKMGVKFTKFIGESKNYITAKLKVDIAYKVEGLKLLTDSSVGCYFTRNGLKGGKYASAKGVVNQFNLKYTNFSIVFTDKDWEFLKESPSSFGPLIHEKLRLVSNQNDTEKVDYEKFKV